MALSGYTEEYESPVAPARLFKATAMESHNLLPKLMPEIVASASLLKGDGGVGSVKQFNFTEAIPYAQMKERVDVLDTDKLVHKFAVIDGQDLGEKLETSVYQFEILPGKNGGSIFKVTAEYKVLPGIEYTEKDMVVAKGGVTGLFKASEAYLLENPDACT
eukprot:TRINITY_DN19607_c0_g1_i1.p1 TRINITY_DN19607_c0_g1~~TRINITY_DN19607_c0_g1_i1.p1  ORF type:complete len:161 (+),score=23.64 TRINITY_DN19607_c0_g1_i1:94-576(+)